MAAWEPRSRLDGFAVWLHGALRSGLTSALVLVAAATLLGQPALTGAVFAENRPWRSTAPPPCCPPRCWSAPSGSATRRSPSHWTRSPSPSCSAGSPPASRRSRTRSAYLGLPAGRALGADLALTTAEITVVRTLAGPGHVLYIAVVDGAIMRYLFRRLARYKTAYRAIGE